MKKPELLRLFCPVLPVLAACAGETQPGTSTTEAATPAAQADGHGKAGEHGSHGEHGAHGGHGGQGAHGEHGKDMPHTFEDAAKWAERFDAPDRDGWQKPTEVVGLMAITPGMTVADLGAGTGYFLPHLAKAVGPTGKTLGLDIEPNLIQWMTERIRKEAIVGAEARLIGVDGPGLEVATVDRVLVVNTWHHIGNRDVYSPRLKTALKPGGMVVVVDYTLESEEGPPKEHRLAPEMVVGELEKAGFEASIAEETLPRQYVVLGRLPTTNP